MPEIRQNMATKEWVIIATERARRPEAFIQSPKERVEDRPPWDERCPFCPGNEELDLERLRLPETGDWTTRVVANRYPALQSNGERERIYDGVNRRISGVGHHEVVVESRRHNTCMAIETLEEVELTLRAFQLRGLAFRDDPRVEQVICFKNHGTAAGASLVHPHAQMLALPVVPYSIRSRSEEALRYCDDHGACVICEMRRDEEQERARIIYESAYFTAFVPYAAYSPFHVWVVPRRHRASFLDCAPAEIRDLSVSLRTVLRKIYFGLNDPDYNYVIRSSPERERNAEHLHWYAAVIPRVSHTAGFELGAGMYINSALPEESAHFLRTVETE